MHPELQVIRDANKVIVISDGMKNDFGTIFHRDYEVITNGFDEDDLPEKTIVTDNKFSVAHIGSLVKSRNPEVLWKVLQDLAKNHSQFANDLEIKLVGKVDFFVSEAIEKAGLAGFVKKIEYLPHDKVIEEQMKSQVLLLLINNTPNAGMILTGKFFEYMATRRPILCIGPENGDAADIIRETGCGFVSGFDDDKTLKNNILKLYDDFKRGTTKLNFCKIDQYSRRTLTQKLSEILTSVAG